MTCRFALPFVLLFTLPAAGAAAGTLANGGWTPSACGAEPAAVRLDLGNPDAYNRSVEKANDYRKSAGVYLDCLVKEANGDIQLITQSAKAAQQAAREADAKILEDAKTADKKFGK